MSFLANLIKWKVPRTTTDANGNTVLVGADGVDIPLNGEVPGLVADSIGAAAANTALINAALAQPGTVQILTPGVYHILSDGTDHSVLRIGSDTHFHVGHGVILRVPNSGASNPVIVNKNWRSNRGSVTSITAVELNKEATATVTETGHTRQVGDYVLIKGDTSGWYNGVHKVMSVVAGTSYTFKLVGMSDGFSMPNASGTVIAHAADSNILVSGGGIFDANYNGTSGGYRNFGCIFNKVSNLTVTATFRNSIKYAVVLCNAWDCNLSPGTLMNPSDGIHCKGPINNLTIGGVYGSTGDDFIAFTAADTAFAAYDLLDLDTTKNSDGPIEDVDIGPVIIRAGASRSLLLAAGLNAPLKRISVKGVKKSSSLAGFTILLDGPAGVDSYWEDISIDGVYGGYGLNHPIVSVGAVGQSINIKNLRISNIGSRSGDVDGTPFALTNSIVAGSNTNCTIEGLVIDSVDVDVDLTNSTATVALVNFGSVSASYTHTVNDILLSNIVARGTGTTRSLNLALLADRTQFNNIMLFNCKITGNNSQLVNIASSQTGIGRVLIDNSMTAGGSLAMFNTNGAKSLEVHINNVICKESASGALTFSGSAKTYNLYLNNIETLQRLISNTGTGHTFNVRVGSVRVANSGTKTGGNMITIGSGNTWNFEDNCMGIGIDVTTIARRDGTIIYNTNAAAGTLGVAGLVVGQGTAAGSWKLLSNTSLNV